MVIGYFKKHRNFKRKLSVYNYRRNSIIQLCIFPSALAICSQKMAVT